MYYGNVQQYSMCRILFLPVGLIAALRCSRNEPPLVRLLRASCRHCHSVFGANHAPFFCVSAALCDFVRVRLVGVTALVLSTNAPRGTRAGGTYSLAEGVLGVFTSNEPKASRTDKAFVVGTLGGGGVALFHSTIPRPLGHA